jgi:hypothetical protein
MTEPGLSTMGEFLVPILGFFCVFFGMVRRRRYLEVRIRSSPLYPRSGGPSSTGERRVESCVRRISWDLVGFHDRLCGFGSVSSDLWFSSSAMVARSTVLIIGDGCCSGTLVLWDLSMTTSRLSTTTSFAWLWWWRGEDGSGPSARASVCSRR